MTKEKQVCNVLQAEELKNLGVAQVSMLNWCCEHELPQGGYKNDGIYRIYQRHQLSAGNDFTLSAFTVAELGIMLSVFLDDEDKDLSIEFADDMQAKYGDKLSLCFNGEYLGEVLIWCIKNNVISIDQCNEKIRA